MQATTNICRSNIPALDHCEDSTNCLNEQVLILVELANKMPNYQFNPLDWEFIYEPQLDPPQLVRGVWDKKKLRREWAMVSRDILHSVSCGTDTNRILQWMGRNNP